MVTKANDWDGKRGVGREILAGMGRLPWDGNPWGRKSIGMGNLSWGRNHWEAKALGWEITLGIGQDWDGKCKMGRVTFIGVGNTWEKKSKK